MKMINFDSRYPYPESHSCEFECLDISRNPVKAKCGGISFLSYPWLYSNLAFSLYRVCGLQEKFLERHVYPSKRSCVVEKNEIKPEFKRVDLFGPLLGAEISKFKPSGGKLLVSVEISLNLMFPKLQTSVKECLDFTCDSIELRRKKTNDYTGQGLRYLGLLFVKTDLSTEAVTVLREVLGDVVQELDNTILILYDLVDEIRIYVSDLDSIYRYNQDDKPYNFGYFIPPYKASRAESPLSYTDGNIVSLFKSSTEMTGTRMRSVNIYTTTTTVWSKAFSSRRDFISFLSHAELSLEMGLTWDHIPLTGGVEVVTKQDEEIDHR